MFRVLAAARPRVVLAAARPGPSRLDVSRSLCADAATRRKNAFLLLGLEPGAKPNEIKKKYYMLAKRTHPDVIAREAKEAAARAAADTGPKVVNFAKTTSGMTEENHAAAAAKPTVVQFLEVQAAYDILMEEDGEADVKKARTAKAGTRHSRTRTLGEVLCDRLRDEPEVYAELWEEILRDRLRVTESMMDAIFRALRGTAVPGAKAEAARAAQRILYEGTVQGVLTIDTRCSGFVTLLAWCQAEEDELADLALEIIDHITDEDRAHSPAVMAAIGSVFCSGTRSPY